MYTEDTAVVRMDKKGKSQNSKEYKTGMQFIAYCFQSVYKKDSNQSKEKPNAEVKTLSKKYQILELQTM